MPVDTLGWHSGFLFSARFLAGKQWKFVTFLHVILGL